MVKKGDSRLFYDVTPDHTHLAVVGMGTREPPAELVDSEDIDVARETVRIAAAGVCVYISRRSCDPNDIMMTSLQLEQRCFKKLKCARYHWMTLMTLKVGLDIIL